MERQLFVVLQNLTWKCCGSHENCSEVLPKNLFYGTPLRGPFLKARLNLEVKLIFIVSIWQLG